MNGLRQPLERFLRHFLLALQHATRVPVKGSLAGWVGATPEMLRASAPHAPGVGWLVGMAASVAFAVLSLALPDGPLTPLAAAVGCTIATAVLTGGLHEKALAVFAGREAALTLALLAKVSLLGVLAVRSPGAVLTALLAAHAVSRFWPLVLVHTLAAAPEDSPNAPAGLPGVDRRALGVAAAWCLVPLALMALAHGVTFVAAALLASGLVLWVLRRRLQRRQQGFTMDALGAAQQLCEIGFYFGAAVGLSGR